MEYGEISIDELHNRFSYHQPKTGQPERYEGIRNYAHGLASLINNACPASREKALALTHLDEVVMWAIAAIARNE